mmetsp:Transcript_7627/g.23229  ORF Transcript_7627/g.23229 Transcript_7627/m.23229 type:complete len:224 (+) Transcript_7627:1435-2106(+)
MDGDAGWSTGGASSSLREAAAPRGSSGASSDPPPTSCDSATSGWRSMDARKSPGRPRNPAPCTVLPMMGEPRATRMAIMKSRSTPPELCTISRSAWHSASVAGPAGTPVGVAAAVSDADIASSWTVTSDSSTPAVSPPAVASVSSRPSSGLTAEPVAGEDTKLLAMRLKFQREVSVAPPPALSAATGSGSSPLMRCSSGESGDTCITMTSPAMSGVWPMMPCS